MRVVNKYPLYTILPYQNFFLLYSKPSFARLFFKNHSIDLLSGNKETEGVGFLEKKLSEQDSSKHLVFHAFFELGFYFTHGFDELDEALELGIYIEYEDVDKFQALESRKRATLAPWKMVDKAVYKEAFSKGLKHLKRGDCYQYNLTYPFYSKANSTGFSLACQLWHKQSSRGRFANFTYCGHLEKSFLSNSPECLFQVKESRVYSMPIKGTLPCQDSNLEQQTKRLAASSKNESELYMITDLIKNDLNWLSRFKANVLSKKSFFKVPGLLHSYSIIEAPIDEEFNLWKALSCLFPGGSITGAPKKRVVEIIRDIEKDKRGFYCGSTIVRSGNLVAASINIRSCVVDEESGDVTYHAGGGITFESDEAEEYQEMVSKLHSFVDLF
jgi:para-aminobenzoate synthetase component 1